MRRLSIILLLISVASTIVIDCKFENECWYRLVNCNLYICRVNTFTNPTINYLEKTTGIHSSSMTHNKVQAIYSVSKNVGFIPHEMTKVFPNLVAISMYNENISTISQTNFKQYPNLIYINLKNNKITIINKDVFKFNTKLQVIMLEGNKISQIHPKVFDDLNQLKYLEMNGNECVNKDAKDRAEVLNLIEVIKQQCLLNNYSEVNELKDDVKSLNSMINSLMMTQNTHEENHKNIVHELMTNFETNKKDVNQKFESNIFNLKNEIVNNKKLINELKVNITHEESSNYQNFTKFVIQQEPIFFFVALPSLCLLSILNIVMIYFCYHNCSRNNSQKRSKAIIV
ncbi:hypothetical protein PVAND_015502 [Polypedilum vanderplanki]|uniref:Uncharacterized protein n=1 Tax=Polypedilum vanderplanki TaxID=319348 RepID=A0A9J6BDB3_POLVA|nr:hypothetical protein PVAND_015502 [Polypedilum vanderplanki]